MLLEVGCSRQAGLAFEALLRAAQSWHKGLSERLCSTVFLYVNFSGLPISFCLLLELPERICKKNLADC